MARIIAQITMTLASKNVVSDAEHNKDSGKTKTGLNPQTLMVGCSGVLGIGQAENRMTTKGRLLDAKTDLKVNWLIWLKMLMVGSLIILYRP